MARRRSKQHKDAIADARRRREQKAQRLELDAKVAAQRRALQEQMAARQRTAEAARARQRLEQVEAER